MKIVEVGFTHMTKKDSSGNPLRNHATVCMCDSADRYDIHTHFETSVDFGWILSSVEVKEYGAKVVRLGGL